MTKLCALHWWQCLRHHVALAATLSSVPQESVTALCLLSVSHRLQLLVPGSLAPCFVSYSREEDPACTEWRLSAGRRLLNSPKAPSTPSPSSAALKWEESTPAALRPARNSQIFQDSACGSMRCRALWPVGAGWQPPRVPRSRLKSGSGAMEEISKANGIRTQNRVWPPGTQPQEIMDSTELSKRRLLNTHSWAYCTNALPISLPVPPLPFEIICCPSFGEEVRV